MDEIDELEKQMADLEDKHKKLIESKRLTVLDATRMNVKRYNFTAKELDLLEIKSPTDNLASNLRKNDLVKPKNIGDVKSKQKIERVSMYVNPANPSETCSGGQGNKPKWFRDHIDKCAANGLTKEDAKEQMLLKNMSPLNQLSQVIDTQSSD